ncbi:hypothetical protein CN245_31065 [Sinorhizobium meliloti]|nr:hypothetical protein CN245_31065 [Sinorhizobium meliloti]
MSAQGIGSSIQHPRRNDNDITGRRLDVRDRPAFAMIDALTSHPLPKKRMMWAMNGHVFADMGRMT